MYCSWYHHPSDSVKYFRSLENFFHLLNHRLCRTRSHVWLYNEGISLFWNADDISSLMVIVIICRYLTFHIQGSWTCFSRTQVCTDFRFANYARRESQCPRWDLQSMVISLQCSIQRQKKRFPFHV